MPAYLPLEVQRNAMLARSLYFTDSEGVPLDLTGAVFDLGVRYAAGDAVGRLATAQTTLRDPEAGVMDLLLDGAALAGVAGPMEIVELAYDLIFVQDGVRVPLLRGPLHLMPGVS